MKSWKSAFTAILVAETLAIAGFAVSMPVIPLFLQDLGIVDPASLKFWAGMIQSSAGITLAIFAPIWGSLADRYGRRMMLLRAMFGGAVIVSLMAFATHPWQILVLRTLQGCVTGTVAAATVLTAGLAPPAQVALALGFLQTGVSMGNTLGPLVGGVVSDLLGRRASFLVTGVILAAAGVIILRGTADDTHRPAGPGTLGRSLLPEFGVVFKSPVLLSLMAVVFAVQAANSIAAPILPLFIQELVPDARLIGSTTGMVLGAGAASSALAAVLVGRYAGKLGYGTTLIVCMALGSLLTLPQGFVSNPVQLTVLRALSLFFVGGAVPVANALIALNADTSKQGSVYGISSSVSASGGALGPMIGSVSAAFFGFRAVFFATALILGASSLGTYRRRQKKGTGTILS